MGQEQDIIDQITTVTGKIKSQKLDEATRLQALSAAQVLLETLESPFERIIHDVVMSTPILVSIRMGVKLGVFTQTSQSPPHGTTVEEISEQSGASPIVVRKSPNFPIQD